MPFNLTAGGSANYVGKNIAYSCRFNDGDNPYTTRTPGAAGTEETWTFSAWVKLAKVAAANATIFSAYTDANNHFKITFRSNGDLSYGNVTGGVWDFYRSLDRIFRDPNGWMHVCINMDTTNGTAADRTTCWINGVKMTGYDDGGTGGGTDPDASFVTHVNKTIAHYIGTLASGSEQFDGYMAEVHFVDGTAYTASDFGETNLYTGEWVPKTFTGSYGTQGFYLDFSNSADYGSDQSGNGNDLTDSGLATNDQVPDTPTNNYCVISSINTHPNFTLSNGNLTASATAASTYEAIGTFKIPQTGGWYFEVTADTVYGSIGIATDGTAFPYANSGVVLRGNTGDIYDYDAATSLFTGLGANTATDVIMIAYKEGSLWIGRNGTWFNSGNPSAGTGAVKTGITAAWPQLIQESSGTANTATFNFGQYTYAHTVPTNFKNLRSQDLDDPTILNPAKYMNTVLYTGNGVAIGSGGKSVTGFSFQPDFVWIKNRDAIDSHMLFDDIRGVQKYLSSDSTNDEATDSESLSTFDSDGFTVGSNVAVNTNTEDYVAWGWKEGATPGFDIVTYTGDANNSQNVNHSLGIVPKFMIVKSRTTAGTDTGGYIYHASNTAAPETDFLELNGTAVTTDDDGKWADTAPTSSVFTVGGAADSGETNINGDTYVAYLWGEVDGFSSIGKWTGNGSTNGPVITCGFRPAFVFAMHTADTGQAKHLFDEQRSIINAVDDYLLANATSIEATAATRNIDFLANGFKIRTSDGCLNTSGNTYVYIAFASSPFKYARAR